MALPALPETLAASLPGVETVNRRIHTSTMSYLFECTVAGFAGRVALKMWAQGDTHLELREVELMRTVTHPNLVRLLHVFGGDPPAYILEYCAGGSLYTLLRSPGTCVFRKDLSMSARVGAALDIASGVEHLHEHGFLHRDLTSERCLLSAPAVDPGQLPQVKISEFGFARLLASSMTAADPMKVIYVAPEMLAWESKYGLPVDIFSCAMIFFELFSEEEPSGSVPGAQNLAKLTMAIAKGLRPGLELLLPEAQGTDLSALVEECWRQDPEQRPTAGAVVERLRRLMAAFLRA